MRIDKKRLIIINIALICALCLFVVISLILDSLDVKCAFASNMYMYCPGCGGTRAIWSLLRLDIVSVFRYNIVVPVICVLYLYYNITAIVSIRKSGEYCLTKNSFIPIYIFIGIVLLNFLVRNILLWGFGIDLIGDFIS